MWCIPQVDGAYVARMEDVLDLYAETADAKRPVVCFDESPTQLIGEVRAPIPAEPGQPERYDCEYRRNGTANLFVFLDAHGSWRNVKITDQRTAQDFAACMRDLADIHYPDADQIRVVLDNLSTHTAGALYETFPAPEAHRILQRLEFHYTPKHASWLNMVEIEIGVLRGQCLDRRIGERDVLKPKSKHGNTNVTRQAHASNGSSPPRRRGTSWLAPIPTPLNRSKSLCRGTRRTFGLRRQGNRLLATVQSRQRLDDPEDRGADDHELDDCVDERSNIERRGTGLLGICQISVMLIVERDKQVREIDATGSQTKNRIEDFFHQTADYAGESGPNYDADSKIDHIAAYDEGAEFIAGF